MKIAGPKRWPAFAPSDFNTVWVRTTTLQPDRFPSNQATIVISDTSFAMKKMFPPRARMIAGWRFFFIIDSQGANQRSRHASS
jgi:hypothetical protein